MSAEESSRSITYNLGLLKGFWQEGQTVFLDYDGPVISVTMLDRNVVRVRLAPEGKFIPRLTWEVTRPDNNFPKIPYTLTPTPDGVEIANDTLLVKVSKERGRLTVLTRQGEVIVDDGPNGGPGWNGDGTTSCWKLMPTDEHYYGFGERTGLLDKRGKRYTCWTTDPWDSNGDHGPGADSLYQAIPFFMGLRESTGCYGLFLNNTYRSVFDMSHIRKGYYNIEINGGELDYYIIYGPEPSQVVERYTFLTGRMPLPPRWSLGYHQSRWGYYPEAVVRNIATQFRERRIPADVIHLDIDYMDGYRVFTWDKGHFPDMPKMLSDLAAQGFKVVCIIDPGVKRQPEGGYPVYDEGKAKGYFLQNPDGTEYMGYVWPGASVFPDFARADVRQWWGDLHKVLLEAGVKGIWNDMNEPAVHDRPFGSEGGRPTTPPLVSLQGDINEKMPFARGHNVYGLLHDRATYEGMLRLRPNERPFLLTRSGGAGVQQFAAVWTGDNTDLWEHLEMSVPELANLGLSGVAFTGADIGGFVGNGEPELFARWMQLGVFYPFARGHSLTGVEDKEPWTWGSEIEEICRRAINLRYRLLPYLYSQFYTATQTGAPVWRPLLYQFSLDPATYRISDQLMVGDAIMVAPVYRPGQTTRQVYLPDGVWYDFWSDQQLTTKGMLLAQAELDTIPIYMRGGTIVPFGEELQFVDEKPLSTLTLEVYPDASGNASGFLYEDDGISFGYKNGDYCLTRYSCRVENGKTIVEAQREGNYAPASRGIEIWVHGAGDARSAQLPHDNGNWQIEV